MPRGKRREPLTVIVGQSEEEVDLKAWARDYVREVLRQYRLEQGEGASADAPSQLPAIQPGDG